MKSAACGWRCSVVCSNAVWSVCLFVCWFVCLFVGWCVCLCVLKQPGVVSVDKMENETMMTLATTCSRWYLSFTCHLIYDKMFFYFFSCVALLRVSPSSVSFFFFFRFRSSFRSFCCVCVCVLCLSDPRFFILSFAYCVLKKKKNSVKTRYSWSPSLLSVPRSGRWFFILVFFLIIF